MYGSEATTKKAYIGKCTNYFDKIGVAEFLLESGELAINDEILIIGPTTGVVETTVKEIRVDMKNADRSVKGEKCSLPVDQLIRRSDKLYKLIRTRAEG